MTKAGSKPFLALAIGVALAAADARGDSGVGVDTWHANELAPDGGAAGAARDERGTSWLVDGVHRSPGGSLYLCPAEPPEVATQGAWQSYGVLGIGVGTTGGDDANALWNRYVDWRDGIMLGLLDQTFERPEDGTYANVRASHISDDDAYYQAVFGRAGSYKVQAFLRRLPNIVSGNARSIWNGVGTNHLTLPSSLVAGGSTPAEVAAVSAATPERRLSVTRDKRGLGFSTYLTPEWTAYANVSEESRKGARPYGGVFFFNYLLPGNGGILETTRPVDDSTIALSGGLRYAGKTWRLDLGYEGSFYRDRYRSYDYETPFALTPAVPGATSAPIFRGQYATEPDNDAHSLRATLTRRLPLDGEVSVTASGGRMSQNDALIAPVACTGTFGIDRNGGAPGPGNPLLFDCAQWNSPAALSRPRADLAIDTTLVDGRLLLHPSRDIGIRAGLRFDREDYRGTYLAWNPLTGQYGYVTENGAQGSIVPGETGFFDPVSAPSTLTRIRNLPLDLQTIDAHVGVDWKIGEHDTLGATLTRSRSEPSHRERSRVDDDRLKLTFVDRSLDGLVLRANATLRRRSGDRYDFDPYEFTLSSSLPGFVAPPGGVLPHTVDALRKYDLADLDERKLDLMATVMPRADMTISASLRGDWNDYDAVLGRQRADAIGATLEWEWQPSPATRASVYVGHDRSKLRIANVNDLETGSDPALGGETYPLDARWWLDDTQKNTSAGATLTHDFGRVRLDASWSHVGARGIDAYRFASPAALAYFGDGALPTRAFPAMTYRVDSIGLSLRIPIAERVALSLVELHERGRVADWHYQGLDAGRVIDHRVYTDGGPESYEANLLALFVDIRL